MWMQSKLSPCFYSKRSSSCSVEERLIQLVSRLVSRPLPLARRGPWLLLLRPPPRPMGLRLSLPLLSLLSGLLEWGLRPLDKGLLLSPLPLRWPRPLPLLCPLLPLPRPLAWAMPPSLLPPLVLRLCDVLPLPAEEELVLTPPALGVQVSPAAGSAGTQGCGLLTLSLFRKLSVAGGPVRLFEKGRT
jgi:hypothetical protein